VLAGVVTGLRAAKNMRWGDPRLSFTRPIRWLLALWGDDVVPVRASTLAAGRSTWVLRTAATPAVTVGAAEEYLDQLRAVGILLDPAERRDQIVAVATELAAAVGGCVDADGESALIDQLTYLVESPTPLLGRFDPDYLRLPEAVLATVMRKHQRYLPVRDAHGALLPCFVAVANGPIDADAVRAGNETVLRARYEDAAFFHRADLAVAPAQLRQRLAGLTLFDLGSQLVTELTSLAGVMAREYATAASESPAVAQALYEAELPRHTGDHLPTTPAGVILSLADRLDYLAGLATTVSLPTGSSDPFALRRAALGTLALHRTQPSLSELSLVDALTHDRDCHFATEGGIGRFELVDLNDHLVRHKLHKTAVIRVGVDGRLSHPVRRVVSERDPERAALTAVKRMHLTGHLGRHLPPRDRLHVDERAVHAPARGLHMTTDRAACSGGKP